MSSILLGVNIDHVLQPYVMHVELNTQIQFTQQKLLSVLVQTVLLFTCVKTVVISLIAMFVFWRETIQTRMNLEMAVTDEMVEIALAY